MYEADLRNLISSACLQLARLNPRLAAIVRAGHLGCCYVCPTDTTPVWVPAYWQPDVQGWKDGDVVVDPTGAGNAFMGGLGAALTKGKDLDEGTYPLSSKCCRSSLIFLLSDYLGKHCCVLHDRTERIAKDHFRSRRKGTLEWAGCEQACRSAERPRCQRAVTRAITTSGTLYECDGSPMHLSSTLKSPLARGSTPSLRM